MSGRWDQKRRLESGHSDVLCELLKTEIEGIMKLILVVLRWSMVRPEGVKDQVLQESLTVLRSLHFC